MDWVVVIMVVIITGVGMVADGAMLAGAVVVDGIVVVDSAAVFVVDDKHIHTLNTLELTVPIVGTVFFGLKIYARQAKLLPIS
jgi:hypothetical protein